MKEIMNYRHSPNEQAVLQVSTEASTIFLAKVFYWMAIGLGLTGVATGGEHDHTGVFQRGVGLDGRAQLLDDLSGAQ